MNNVVDITFAVMLVKTKKLSNILIAADMLSKTDFAIAVYKAMYDSTPPKVQEMKGAGD